MSSITKRFMSYVGKTKLEDIKPVSLRNMLDQYCINQEKKDPRCTKAEIKGSEMHQSHGDPTDQKKVISIRFLNDDDARVGTGHLHEDGTDKFRYKMNPDSSSKGFE